MTKMMTALGVRSVRPGEKKFEIAVGGARNLYLSVQPSGRRAFVVRYRFNGRPSKLTLDAGLTLAEARAAAAAAWVEIERGVDPMAAKRAQKAAKVAAVNAASNDVGRYAEMFLEQHCRRKNSASQHKPSTFFALTCCQNGAAVTSPPSPARTSKKLSARSRSKRKGR